MKRRNFLASSLAASCVVGASSMNEIVAANQRDDAAQREYYELRLYHLRRNPKSKSEMIDNYFGGVALPAMKRAGVGPVGFFNVMIGPDSPTLYVLLTHKTLESVATAAGRLAADAEYQKAGAAFLNAPATDPTYVRMESSLMVAFSGMPKLEVPAGVAEKKPRLFELRTYESHNKAASRKKIEMFNTGETALFRRTGLQPVFFGETLIGTKLPNLTYMLTFPDMATRDKNWGTFIADPEWKKMSATPGFTDAEIVTNISSVFLRPTSYSEI